MTRFNPSTYDPASDSSERHGKTGLKGVVLVVATKGPKVEGKETELALCLSGIGKQVNKGRKFSQGGDARLKGILQRAHVTGTQIHLVRPSGTESKTAMAVAKDLGWESYLTRFEEAVKAKANGARPRKAAAKKAPAKKAAAKNKKAAAASAPSEASA